MKKLKDHLITSLVILFGIPIGLIIAMIYLFIFSGIVIANTVFTIIDLFKLKKCD